MMTGMKRMKPPNLCTFKLIFVLSFIVAGLAGESFAEVEVAILPAENVVAPGATFDVEFTVNGTGSGFNGFDLFVGYDPTLLTLIAQQAIEQQGPLMKEACDNTPFHVFQVASDSTKLSVTYVLMCAGVSVTGPGVVYRLRFQAGLTEGTTQLELLEGTNFYNAGIIVSPLVTENAVVDIVSGTNTPPEPVETGLNLRAAPNPFNPQTVVSFDLPRPGVASLTIYATNGHKVVTLMDDFLGSGLHRVPWNGRDQNGRAVASGIYRVRLEAVGLSEMRSVALVK
jgi:hypothetical protein